MGYSHTQKAPLHLMLFALGGSVLIVAWLVRDEWPVSAILGGAALLIILFGFMFAHLTVSDDGDALIVRYGPLPVFWRRIPYATC